MEPTNQDIIDAVEKQEVAFTAHITEDHAFQDETRRTDKGIQATLLRIEGRLDKLDHKFDSEHHDYAFKKMDMMYAIYQGLGFSKQMLVVLAAIIGSLVVIIGGIFSAIKFIR